MSKGSTVASTVIHDREQRWHHRASRHVHAADDVGATDVPQCAHDTDEVDDAITGGSSPPCRHRAQTNMPSR